MLDFDTQILLALLATPALGRSKIRTLLAACGTPTSIWQQEPSHFLSLQGFTPKLIESLQTKRQQELPTFVHEKIQLIPYHSPLFPQTLKELSDPPLLLYVSGNLNCLKRAIAIVGTRTCTLYGKENAFQFAEELAASGFTILSGLARGIDTAAHIGALKKGLTAAIIGSGLEHIYPKENQQLAHTIANQGILLSEYPPNAPPHASQFPRRNWLISALALGAVLIEAPEKSGAMLTLHNALTLKRPCFALPGPIGDDFKGNHTLIKTGQAQLVESAQEVIAHFETLFPISPVLPSFSQFNFTREEKQFYDRLPKEPICIDRILAIMDTLPIHQIQVVLMSLILKRAVKELPGKNYKKNQ